MKITFDREADAVYVLVSEETVDYTDIIDDERFVHYTAAGAIRGFEFLDASHGVNLLGLPLRGNDVGGALQGLGIPVIDPIQVVKHAKVPPVSTSRAQSAGVVGFSPRFVQSLGPATSVSVEPPRVTFTPTSSGEIKLGPTYA